MKTQSFRSALSTLAVVGLLPLTNAACGFLISQGPPEGHEQMDAFGCTTGDAGPILDIVWGGLNLVGALRAASDPEAYANSDEIVAVGLSWAVVSGASAAVGFNKSKRCRAAVQQLAQRQAEVRAAGPAPGDLGVEAVVIVPVADTLAPGERVQLVATAHRSSGALVPNAMFTWSSSNDAIASVGSAGLVTAHAAGAVVIAARTDNVVGMANIVVVPQR